MPSPGSWGQRPLRQHDSTRRRRVRRERRRIYLPRRSPRPPRLVRDFSPGTGGASSGAVADNTVVRPAAPCSRKPPGLAEVPHERRLPSAPTIATMGGSSPHRSSRGREPLCELRALCGERTGGSTQLMHQSPPQSILLPETAIFRGSTRTSRIVGLSEARARLIAPSRSDGSTTR